MKKRLTGLAIVLAVLAIGMATTPALAEDVDRGAYLALGDSVPFGFSPLVTPAERSNPNVFVGYPEAFAAQNEMAVTNLACPGETSASLISSSGIDNGCRRYRSRFPLHAAYSGPQLGAAVAFLRSHPDTRLVSISIGHNDLTLLAKACNNVEACELAGLPDMLAHLAQNLRTILSEIRATGYEGRLVAVTYYAQNYADLSEVTLIRAVDLVLATVSQEFDGEKANGFRAFRLAAKPFDGDACAAGLLIVVSTKPLTCDLHPSPIGRDLLARTMRRSLQGAGARSV